MIQIAGIRFDTSAEDDPNPPPGTGPRWRPLMRGIQGKHKSFMQSDELRTHSKLAAYKRRLTR